MKALEEQMSVYGAYHRDGRNRATHFVGVPIIVFASLVACGWLRVDMAGVTVSGAMLLALLVLGYYFGLDVTLAAAMTVLILFLLYFSERVAQWPFAQSLAAFLILFVGGWILQLVGHYFEGRKPALVDNFFQVLVAPIFLLAEAFFALGWKPALRERVEHLVASRMQGRSQGAARDGKVAA